MRTLISDMKLVADALERLACEMPAPNDYTPRFMSLAVTIRHLANEGEMRRRKELGLDEKGLPAPFNGL